LSAAAAQHFLLGAVAMASLIAGLLFLKLWRVSRDRLFALFAVAFWLLTLNWVVLAFANVAAESQYRVYLIRLLAFLLIGLAIVDKNRRG
jgi:hypothetical protein